jgi:DNA primase
MIERAKAYPIENLLEEEPSQNGKYLCPLHTEKTASLHIYKENNTWHCFGCGEGGDSISLYRAISGCSFIEAINFLAKNT